MKLVYHGDTIECNSSEIISRDIRVSSIIDVPEIGKCRKYNCKRNSEASIIEELDPKKAKYKTTSNLNLNDLLECEDLYFLMHTMKPLKIEIINKSGRHKAQKGVTKCFTYAEITQQFPNIPQKIEKQLSSPAKQIENKKEM